MTDLSTTAGKLDDLRARHEEAQAPTPARARIEALVDAASFAEVDALARHRVTAFGLDADKPATDGVITGYATIDGRKVCVLAHDASIFDGRLGEVYGEKILKLQRLARTSGVPLISFVDGLGARSVESTAALAAYAQILAEATEASGVIPQITAITGPLGGPHRLLPGLADITIASGDNTADVTVGSDEDIVPAIKDVLGYLPANNRAEASRPLTAQIQGPVDEVRPALDALIPDEGANYDVREVLAALADEEQLTELRVEHASEVITAFGRVEGRSVGFVANQDTQISADAAAKAAGFIQLCDAFNVPVVTITDAEAADGTAAVLAAAYAQATVGLVTVVVRKAIGTAGLVMGSKTLGVDLVFAWPTAQIAAAEAEQAVPEIHARELAKADRKGKDVEKLREKLTREYEDAFLSPYQAAERGTVDAVIEPAATRTQLVEGLRLLDRKVVASPDRKHTTYRA